MAITLKVGSRYQVVIPKEIRKKLNIDPHSEVLVSQEGDKIVIWPKPKNFTQYMLGLGKEVWEGVDALEYVRNLRSEWGPKDEEK